MSKNKSFSETSAGRYSLALYELAAEANILSEIEDHSASIIDLISSSEDFRSLIKDPTNNKEDQLKALKKISEQYKLNELLTKFLSFLKFYPHKGIFVLILKSLKILLIIHLIYIVLKFCLKR